MTLTGLVTTALRAFVPALSVAQADVVVGSVVALGAVAWSVAEKQNWFKLGDLVKRK